MTIDFFHYCYGVIVDPELIDEKIEEQFLMLEIISIPHNISRLDEDDCKGKVIFGKMLNSICIGTGKIPKLNKVSSETKQALTDFITLLKLKNKPDYMTLPNDCNCCS
jgi:hypothetical protein